MWVDSDDVVDGPHSLRHRSRHSHFVCGETVLSLLFHRRQAPLWMIRSSFWQKGNGFSNRRRRRRTCVCVWGERERDGVLCCVVLWSMLFLFFFWLFVFRWIHIVLFNFIVVVRIIYNVNFVLDTFKTIFDCRIYCTKYLWINHEYSLVVVVGNPPPWESFIAAMEDSHGRTKPGS